MYTPAHSQQLRVVEIPDPSGIGTMRVYQGGKTPKRQYHPGMLVLVDGQHYGVVFAYRAKDRPSTWCYQCCTVDNVAAWRNRSHEGKRAISEIFRDFTQARQYFRGITTGGDGKVFTTSELNGGIIVQPEELRSSDR